MTTADTQSEVNRRAFLVRAIGACTAFLATVLGIPAVGASIGPALRREDSGWVTLGNPDSFREGEPTAAEFSVTRKDGWMDTTEIKAVWVVRGGGEFTVFNGRCTHLGCAYRWLPDKNHFLCPCHDGIFAKDGRVISGPPPRGLDPLETRVEGGSLQVKYRDFRLGTAERVVS